MKKKIKAKHNTVSNVFYMLRVMFKISPGLVIGEIAEQIMGALPSKLISVIGLKYVIDEVQNGGDPKKIILAIASMLGIIIACESIHQHLLRTVCTQRARKTRPRYSVNVLQKGCRA